jgi:hypothetical protein
MKIGLGWGLVIVATIITGLALFLAGVALGRTAGGAAGYVPAGVRPSIDGPAGAGASDGRVDGRFVPGPAQPGVTNVNPGLGIMGAGMMGGSLDPAMAGPGMMGGSSFSGTLLPGSTDGNFGPGAMRGGMMNGSPAPGTWGPGMMGGAPGPGGMGPGMMR